MIVVVPVDPPWEGLVLRSLPERSPLTVHEATRLYRASVADVLHAVAASGGDLLVTYRDEETLPEGASGDDPATAVRGLVETAVDADVRLERQVGSTRSARRGNAVTHLLSAEDPGSVGVLEPTAALVGRTEIDGAAMTVRRHDVILGPDGAGSTYLAAFATPIDFTAAFEEPALPSIARAATDGGREVGFVRPVPSLDTVGGLRATVAAIDARRVAGEAVPRETAAVLDDLELAVDASGAVVRN